MTREDIFKTVDHTLLAQTATWEEIKEICDDAIKYQTASVCIPASYVKRAKDYVDGKMAICTVIGFPNGYSTTAVKEYETKDAILNGADEIDMVINVAALKDGEEETVYQDILAVRRACEKQTLKVIIETCLLTDDEKRTACRLAEKAGADFVKTSTGRAGASALSHIRIMREALPAHVGIKFSGFGTLNAPELALWAFFLGADVLGSPCGDVVVDVLSSGYAEVGMLAGS